MDRIDFEDGPLVSPALKDVENSRLFLTCSGRDCVAASTSLGYCLSGFVLPLVRQNFAKNALSIHAPSDAAATGWSVRRGKGTVGSQTCSHN